MNAAQSAKLTALQVDERMQLRHRQEAAISILLDHGWTEREVERALDGLTLEDSATEAERHAKAALGIE